MKCLTTTQTRLKSLLQRLYESFCESICSRVVRRTLNVFYPVHLHESGELIRRKLRAVISDNLSRQSVGGKQLSQHDNSGSSGSAGHDEYFGPLGVRVHGNQECGILEGACKIQVYPIPRLSWPHPWGVVEHWVVNSSLTDTPHSCWQLAQFLYPSQATRSSYGRLPSSSILQDDPGVILAVTVV